MRMWDNCDLCKGLEDYVHLSEDEKKMFGVDFKVLLLVLEISLSLVLSQFTFINTFSVY